jgi:NAD-dependent histone deacetylase SIR2
MCLLHADGLEIEAGVPKSKVVAAHGTFRTSRCVKQAGGCGKEFHGPTALKNIQEGIIPKCLSCGSVVKPDIVFFGEQLPEQFHEVMANVVPRADLLLVLGTALKVAPVCDIVDCVSPNIPRVVFNMTRVGEVCLFRTLTSEIYLH